MKQTVMQKCAVAFLALLFAGCNYDAPLVGEATLPVDSALLGVWATTPDGAKPSEEPLEALVLQFTNNEYVIHYPRQRENTLYFRGYGVEIAGATYLQTQLIGSEKGPVKVSDRKYDLITYSLKGDVLEVALLNPEVVSKKAKKSEALLKAFLAKADHPGRFGKSVRFHRLPERSGE